MSTWHHVSSSRWSNTRFGLWHTFRAVSPSSLHRRIGLRARACVRTFSGAHSAGYACDTVEPRILCQNYRSRARAFKKGLRPPQGTHSVWIPSSQTWNEQPQRHRQRYKCESLHTHRLQPLIHSTMVRCRFKHRASSGDGQLRSLVNVCPCSLVNVCQRQCAWLK